MKNRVLIHFFNTGKGILTTENGGHAKVKPLYMLDI
jgi:hypothetical protein